MRDLDFILKLISGLWLLPPFSLGFHVEVRAGHGVVTSFGIGEAPFLNCANI